MLNILDLAALLLFLIVYSWILLIINEATNKKYIRLLGALYIFTILIYLKMIRLLLEV